MNIQAQAVSNAVNVTFERVRLGAPGGVAFGFKIIADHVLKAGSGLPDFTILFYLVKDVQHLIIGSLHLGWGVADAPSPGHIVEVAALDHTWKGVKHDAGAKWQRFVVVALAMGNSGIAPLPKNTAARFFNIHLQLPQPDKLLDFADGQGIAVCVYSALAIGTV